MSKPYKAEECKHYLLKYLIVATPTKPKRVLNINTDEVSGNVSEVL